MMEKNITHEHARHRNGESPTAGDSKIGRDI
jgi:hypothetical protein